MPFGAPAGAATGHANAVTARNVMNFRRRIVTA
jgi:hypothetical protein